jgi:hypothetical protein
MVLEYKNMLARVGADVKLDLHEVVHHSLSE